MIFEDVHWIDPTSLEALGRGIDRIKSVGALLIVTYRPDFEPPWIGRPYGTALILNQLGEREIDAMIDHVTGNRRLPESVRPDTIERTDGIPLAGEIALTSSERNEAEAETHFERALTVAKARVNANNATTQRNGPGVDSAGSCGMERASR